MSKELARSIEKNIRASELASRMAQHLKTNNRSFLPKDISDAVTGHFKTSHLWADQNQPVIVKIDIMIGGQLSTPVFSVARSLSR